MDVEYWYFEYMPAPYREEWIRDKVKYNSCTGAAIAAASYMKDAAAKGDLPAVRLRYAVKD